MFNKRLLSDILEEIRQKKGWAGLITPLAAACLSVFHQYGAEVPHTTAIQVTLGLIVAVGGLILLIPRPAQEPVNGLLPFFESDAELFKSLERDIDVRKLQKRARDDQSPLEVLIGDPASGKSSLLRAGLIPSLPSSAIYYWQARPDSAIDHLTTSIEQHFKVSSYRDLFSKPISANDAPIATAAQNGKAVPTDTTDDAKAAKSPVPNNSPLPEDIKCRVVVIDHFDFLRPEHPSHEPFFKLLQELCAHPASYRLKFMIVFRKPYGPVWHTIRQNLAANPLQVPISPLDPEMAIRIMNTLLKRARVAIDSQVINAYVARFSFRNEVSPFAVGLGTAIFSTWAQAQKSKIKLRDYLKKGGQNGVIADHVEQRLKALTTSHWESIGAAIYRELVDSETGTRNMGGVGVAELAATAGVNASDMKVHLQTLSGADVRILEQVDTEPQKLKYRLAQDCFVEVLGAIKRQGSTEAFRLRSAFWEQFEGWQKSGAWSKWKHLLSKQQLNDLSSIQDLQNETDGSE